MGQGYGIIIFFPKSCCFTVLKLHWFHPYHCTACCFPQSDTGFTLTIVQLAVFHNLIDVIQESFPGVVFLVAHILHKTQHCSNNVNRACGENKPHTKSKQ